MAKYPIKKATSKIGVNYVRTIIETNNCIFNEIHQENDVGIDAIMEIVNNEIATGKCIALQVKSGKSYFDTKKNECMIPIDNHYDYWTNYALPVFGIVYVPEQENSYWIDIKKILKTIKKGDTNLIKFSISKLNIFNIENFNKIFVPYINKEIPILNFEESVDLFKSNNLDEKHIGITVLFKKFANKNETWSLFISFFKETEVEMIPSKLIYYLSYIPWHPDLFWNKETITKESKEFAASLIRTFKKDEIVKLLYYIDENFIERGSLGQSVEAIISIIPKCDILLSEIYQDNSLSQSIREYAKSIYEYHLQRKKGI